MLKVFRRRWFILSLPGLLLLAAFLIGGGGPLVSGVPVALAASSPPGRDGLDCTSGPRQASFGSVVVVNSGEVICSNLTSFGGTIVIQGVVKGNVVSFGGKVVIDGRVEGNVTLYEGNVTLQNNAHVDGNIHLCGGHWVHGADSQLRGSVFECTTSAGLLALSAGRPSLSIWSILTWVALGLLLTSLLPEHVMLVRTTVSSKMRRSLVLGFLSALLAPAVLAVLIALIISIPLAIIVAIGLVAAWALGTVAIGWLVGDYILRTLTPHQHTTRMAQVVVGLVVLVLLESLPYIGWLVSIGAGLLGLGAVFLSRFGTRLYTQPRQPLPL
jgi:hypothetical protein